MTPSPDPRELACICVPSYDSGTFETEQLLAQLRADGWTLYRLQGLSHVGRARSHLATQALGLDSRPWLMWIDADMLFDPDDVGRMIRAADRSGAELVGGVYVGKEVQGGKFCCQFVEPRGVVLGEGGGLVPVTHIGFGFVATHRRAFDLIASQVPKVHFGRGPDGGPMFGRAWFQDLIEGDHFWGEDYAFCTRLRRAGGTCLADTRRRLYHLGRYAYGWEDAAHALIRGESIELGDPLAAPIEAAAVPAPLPAPAPTNRAARRRAARIRRQKKE